MNKILFFKLLLANRTRRRRKIKGIKGHKETLYENGIESYPENIHTSMDTNIFFIVAVQILVAVPVEK